MQGVSQEIVLLTSHVICAIWAISCVLWLQLPQYPDGPGSHHLLLLSRPLAPLGRSTGTSNPKQNSATFPLPPAHYLESTLLFPVAPGSVNATSTPSPILKKTQKTKNILLLIWETSVCCSTYFMHSLVASCMCPDQRWNLQPWCIGMMP